MKFNEFLTEAVKINKATQKLVDDIKHLYNIDLTDHINTGNKRNFMSFETDELSDNDVRNVERFAHDKGLRMEPNGAKKFAIYFNKE